MTTKAKSPEIERLMQFMAHEKLTAAELAARLDMPYRTVTNYIWNDQELSGRFLKKVHRVFGVSIDWLVSDDGDMLTNERPEADLCRPLIPYLQNMQLNTVQDFFILTARCIEQSMLRVGAVPGQDYSILDLYSLAGPFVLHRFQSTNMELAAADTAEA